MALQKLLSELQSRGVVPYHTPLRAADDGVGTRLPASYSDTGTPIGAWSVQAERCGQYADLDKPCTPIWVSGRGKVCTPIWVRMYADLGKLQLCNLLSQNTFPS